MSTLTYVYQDSTAVLGPLSRTSEPHAYDLCRRHASSLTAPRGWEVLRVPGSTEVSDDLVALTDAVHPRRRPQAPEPPAGPLPGQRPPEQPQRSAEQPRSGQGPHLHVIRSSHE